MSKPLSFEEISAVLSSQGIPFNESTVRDNCNERRNYCGCGKKAFKIDQYSVTLSNNVTQYDCGCSAAKPQLPERK